MNAIATLGSLLGLAFTSGVNLYATVGIVGLCIKYQWVTGTPDSLNVLASWPIIIIALILYAIEFIADKIPVVDSVWDSVHTFIRPIGGAGLAFASAGDASPGFQVMAILLGGSVAFTTHSTKTATRLVVNTSPEPVSNSVVSILEDIGVLTLAYMAIAHPYIALVITLTLLFCIIYFGPRIFRLFLFYITAILSKITSLISKTKASDFLPSEHLTLLGLKEEPKLVSKCLVRRFKEVGPNRFGYIILTNTNISVTYKKLFCLRHQSIEFKDIKIVRLNNRFLYDILEVHLENRYILFVFSKTRTALAEEFKKLLSDNIK